jgi:hypothetical protein
MDEHEQKALDDIEKHGCHILHVMEEDDYPRFTYSIGIEKTTNKPDIIITGLKRELAHWMINEYRRRIAEGEVFEPMEFYQGFLEGFDITFVEVDKKHYEEYLGWGLWYNKGTNFNMLQLVFPNTSGVWPWNENASQDFTWFQPLLNAS